MNREQAKEFIGKTFGIEDVSDEMVSAYLNNLNGAVKAEKDRADKLKVDASMVDDLKAQLEALNNAKLSDVEKANKATEQANAQIADLQKQIQKMNTLKSLADIGIVGEQADSFFNEDGTINFETLGTIISAREAKASSLKEQELMKSMPTPQGGNKGNEKSDAEKIAEQLGKAQAESNKKASDILANYI